MCRVWPVRVVSRSIRSPSDPTLCILNPEPKQSNVLFAACQLGQVFFLSVALISFLLDYYDGVTARSEFHYIHTCYEAVASGRRQA